MNNRNVIRNFFNRLAPDWMDEDELVPVRDEIVRRSALSENRIILDAGCGKGVMVPHLLSTNPSRLLELDLSDEMIRLNRLRWEYDSRISFLCDDILTADLPVPDAVFIFNAYPHLLDKTALAKKLSHLLPADGTVVIAHISGKDFINQIHHDSGACEMISIPLKSPLEEYEPYGKYFSLTDWEDSDRLYYMKLTRK